MCRNIFRLILRPVSALSLVFSMVSVVVCGRAFFGFEPDIVRRVVTSRSGLYEGLGCSKWMVYL
jgi:hypothetical protein